MFAHHLPLLRCPKSGSELELIVDVTEHGQVKTGQLNAKVGDGRYPIINFIPRFVPLSNYADSFSLEWKTHARTQYDSVSGVPLSETRFFQETGWPRRMEGEIILEIGSGSGRFTEWALSTGATVVSLDYSQAVEANFASNGANTNLLLVQASIYEMPFEKEFADRAFCFGMIQHTPDPKKAFMAVPPFIKPGGYFASDVYRKSLRTIIGTRHLFRLFTSRMEP
ncbi:MAG: methyltransferase domain-containing protein, partial [Alphaproteobacteria bacterium]|nr:methyltransferase domain-containing protein [Alphaproteobacteria bacterium]